LKRRTHYRKKNSGENPIPSPKLVVTTVRKEHVGIKSDRYDHEDHSVDEYCTFIYENFQTPINERLQWWGKILENNNESEKLAYLQTGSR
jgi:hypothetical protein